jgi:hypothetical protein
MEIETKIKDFVILPRKIRDDYLEGKLSRNELDVLLWIWLNTNPVNGYFTADYKALEREFQNRISYDNVRKIISSLRKKQYVFFLDHKGRRGSFPIYPIGFILTSGQVQTLEYLKNKLPITTSSQSYTQPETELKHNLEDRYHNFQKQREELIKQFSMNGQASKITTPYNDTDNKNNNIIDNKNIFNRSLSFAYKKERISPENFFPKSYEEEQCWKIAKKLGETDMRFILSCLRKYGFGHIERAWGIFKEIPSEKIQNPRKYFNKLIKNKNVRFS